jgi:catechol 2,3-dioxygenase-like lactoylglutathione lyase family enzyme
LEGTVKVNHLNLTVTDVPATAAFLEKYFGLENQWAGEEDEKFAVLFDDDGLVLTLIKGGQALRYPGSFHIGFIQESEERVNEIHKQLQDDGYSVRPPARLHAWTFYVTAPGGFSVEVLA